MKLGTTTHPDTTCLEGAGPLTGRAGNEPLSGAALREIPLKGMRGMIASKMLQSLQTTAQLTHQASACLEAAQALRAHCRQQGFAVPSLQDLLLRLVIQTLADFPSLNATLEENCIVQHGTVHLGLAIPLPDDLLVAPAMFGAESLSLGELSEARRELTAKAQAGRLGVRELTGATFTVSNLGRSRVHHFTPILNVPQVAILGIGGIESRAMPVSNGWRAAEFIGLSLTFDHRAVNGAPAAAFLDTLCERIETLAPEAFDHELVVTT